MSSVQKKRKTGKSSTKEAALQARQAAEEEELDTDDEKLAKRKASRAREGHSFRDRLLIVFVTIVCILFYDAAHVHSTIYSQVFLLPAKSIVDQATKDALRKHRVEGTDIVLEDTKTTSLLLIRTGAVNKPHEEYEKERLRRALAGDEDVAAQADDDSKDSETLVLFKDKNQVLATNQLIEEGINARAGRATFTLSHGGFDLQSATLRPGEKIHGSKVLEDIGTKLRHSGHHHTSADGDSEDGSGDADEDGDSDEEDSQQTEKQTLGRELAFAKRQADPEFVKFTEEIRADNTFAHLGKKNDMERALKQLGYKQSTKSSRKAPMWIGFEDKGKCPAFKKDEMRISFCPFYIPQNKADQYSHIQTYAEKVPDSKLKPDFYPLTWRLYKESERKLLKLHCTNESMSEFGEAYVRKFTVPGSNYMKSAESIYDQLMKSDKKVKELTKETKNKAIVQLYINNPLLLEERKFIIRTFAVIVSAKPFIVYYHDGAVFRSVVKYKPFTRHDSDYKKAAHITNEQKSAQKKVLKSSELYTSFNSLQTYLARDGHNEKYVNNVLRPQMKARMIYALYAILKRQRSNDEQGLVASLEPEESSMEKNWENLPSSAAIVQTSCFDFLLDEKKKLWLITVATGAHCFINMGGSSFRPAWKAKLQEELSDNTAKLAEEVLWRRMNKKPLSSMRFFTPTAMTVLIDETFPDWDVTQEINAHMEGIQVAQDNRDYNMVSENDEMEVDASPGAVVHEEEDDGPAEEEEEVEEDDR